MLCLAEHEYGRRFSISGDRCYLGRLAYIKLTVTLPRHVTRNGYLKIVTSVNRELLRWRVDSICFRSDFPVSEFRIGEAVSKCNSDALLSAKAADIVLCECKCKESCAVFSDRFDKYTAAAALKLGMEFRRIFITVPDVMRGYLENDLMKNGISPVFGIHSGIRADAAVIFGKTEVPEIYNYGCVLCTDTVMEKRSGERKILFSVPEYFSSIPEGYDKPSVAAYALSNGYIDSDSVSVVNSTVLS